MIKNNSHLYLLILLVGILGANPSFTQEKIKGISFVAANSPISKVDVKPIVDINANWVTLMPYGVIGNDKTVVYNSKWQWWGEKPEGIGKTITLCNADDLKVMIKPQIWINNGYTGDFKLTNEKDWIKFENSYRKFIFTFLEVAIENKAELFCIGTEWREFVANRPAFWTKLIRDIRAVYSGELTYAANWDDYSAVSFWNKLDFIGIDAYFPISYSTKPKLKELLMGWEVHRKKLANFAKQNNAQILFTEIGYRSMIGATVTPWEHGTKAKYSAEIQNLAYQALFKILWDEPWFKGIFIWKWFHNHSKQGGPGDIDFTPQNKPAEKTIRSFWAD